MEPTPWLNANFKDPLFISEAAAAMAAAKQEALMLDGIRAEGDDERLNGSRVTRVEAIAFGSDARALVYTDARDLVQSGEFALSLPGGGVLTAQSKTLPDERSEIERRWESAFRV
jgi:hypothetical protein